MSNEMQQWTNSMTPSMLQIRPSPFVGMPVCIGYNKWETVVQVGLYVFLSDATPLHISNWRLWEEGKPYCTIRLPGEPGCWPLPSKYQVALKEGDRYLYFDRGRLFYSEDGSLIGTNLWVLRERLVPGCSIYVPADKVEEVRSSLKETKRSLVSAAIDHELQKMEKEEKR
jgi:hypothetical protein